MPNNAIAFDRSIEVAGNCPEPVLKSAHALRRMEPGAVLRVSCLDPVSVKDLAAFSKQTGNALLGQCEERSGDSVRYVHFLKKRG